MKNMQKSVEPQGVEMTPHVTIWQRIAREPVLITGLFTAFFGLLVAFGVGLSDVQIGSIVGFIGVVMALLRALVTPSSEVVAHQPPDQPVPQAGPKADVEAGTDVEVVTRRTR